MIAKIKAKQVSWCSALFLLASCTPWGAEKAGTKAHSNDLGLQITLPEFERRLALNSESETKPLALLIRIHEASGKTTRQNLDLVNPSLSLNVENGPLDIQARYLMGVARIAGDFADLACKSQVDYYVSFAQINPTISADGQVVQLSFPNLQRMPLVPLAFKLDSSNWPVGTQGVATFLDPKLEQALPSGCADKTLGSANLTADGQAKMKIPLLEGSLFEFSGGISGQLSIAEIKDQANTINTFWVKGSAAATPQWQASTTPESSFVNDFLGDLILPNLNILSPLTSAQVSDPAILQGVCEPGIDIGISGTGLSANQAKSAPCVDGKLALSVALSSGSGLKEISLAQINRLGARLTKTLTVNLQQTNVPQAPTISNVANLTTPKNTPLNGSVVNIADADSVLDCAKSLSVSSSNTTLLPLANITFAGTAPLCTLNMSPAANMAGLSSIKITVTDGTLTNSTTFDFTVSQTNVAPSGVVSCALAGPVLIGRPGDSFSFTCNGATDADGPTDISYQMSSLAGSCPSFTVLNSITGGVTGGAAVAGVTGAFGSAGDCIFKAKACDAASVCTAESATYKISSFTATASLAAPSLASDCTLSIAGSTSVSGNISNQTYTGSLGLTGTTVSSGGLNVALNLADHGAGAYTANWGVATGDIAGLTNLSSVFATATPRNFNITLSDPTSYAIRTPAATIAANSMTGRQMPASAGANACVAKGSGNYALITAGANHTCALTTGGGVKCWGDNTYGQLGDGTTTTRTTPVDVSGLTSGVAAIATGQYHTCALTTGGGAKCWGYNFSGQLGDGTTLDKTTPTDVTGLTNGVTAIAASYSHSCAITTGGGVKCWGSNLYGQLGDGTTLDKTTPTDVTGLTNGVTAIAAGYYHTCAITTAGGGKCWGSNSAGSLGDGSSTQRLTAVDVSGLTSGVAAIATGNGHTCALTTGGGVKCWGRSIYGSVGDGTTSNHLYPTQVTGLTSGVSAITGGYAHTCAVMSAGSVKCWGYNASGQVGDGSSTDWFIPSDVSVLSTPITAVAAGYSHSCALTSGGSVKCWGLNGSGQMGDGTTTQRTTPADVDGHSSGIASLALGPDSSCALSATGGVKCWGRNNGNVGNGTTRDQRTPSQVTGLTSGVVSISAGGGTGHTCAVFDTGALKCWGYNASGQIGDNSTTTRNTATNVTGSTSGVSAVSTGDLHTCLLSTGGGVKCWGDNTYGQIGDGTITQRLTPTDVFGLTSGVAAISAGNNHTCAVTTLGALQCWGENSTGQLGDGTTTPSLTPTAVSGLTSGVVAVAAGKNYTCALTTGGGVKCWGANNYRTIGDGTFTQRLVPTDTTGLTSGVASITAGSDHTCAVTTGGGAKCWGHNNYGKSSNGTVSSYLSTPADVAGFTSGVAAVAVGGDHTCLLNIGGGMKCWGNGSFGQLGLYWMTTVTGLSGIGLIEKIFALP